MPPFRRAAPRLFRREASDKALFEWLDTPLLLIVLQHVAGVGEEARNVAALRSMKAATNLWMLACLDRSFAIAVREICSWPLMRKGVRIKPFIQTKSTFGIFGRWTSELNSFSCGISSLVTFWLERHRGLTLALDIFQRVPPDEEKGILEHFKRYEPRKSITFLLPSASRRSAFFMVHDIPPKLTAMGHTAEMLCEAKMPNDSAKIHIAVEFKRLKGVGDGKALRPVGLIVQSNKLSALVNIDVNYNVGPPSIGSYFGDNDRVMSEYMAMFC
jgi:hypothetical protein